RYPRQHGACVIGCRHRARARIVLAMPQYQLAAPRKEWTQIRFVCFVHAGKRSVAEPLGVGDGKPRQVDWSVHCETEQRVERAVAHVAARAVGPYEHRPAGLATPAHGMHEPFAIRVSGPLVYRAQRSNLRGREAAIVLGSRALNGRWVPAALARVVDQPVFEPVLRIAGRHGRVLSQLQIGGGETAVVPREGLVAEYRAGLRLKRVDRRSGADRVVVLRESLRL